VKRRRVSKESEEAICMCLCLASLVCIAMEGR
jgi:hypothetical protein